MASNFCYEGSDFSYISIFVKLSEVIQVYDLESLKVLLIHRTLIPSYPGPSSPCIPDPHPFVPRTLIPSYPGPSSRTLIPSYPGPSSPRTPDPHPLVPRTLIPSYPGPSVVLESIVSGTHIRHAIYIVTLGTGT